MQTTAGRTRFNRGFAAAGFGGALAAAVLVVAAGRAGFRATAGTPAARPAAAVSAAQTGAAAGIAPAYRMTYYLVGSEEQAARVQQEIDDGDAEAFAGGVPAAPSRVVIIHSPEEQAVFEAGINECGSIPGCARSIANEVDLRAER